MLYLATVLVAMVYILEGVQGETSIPTLKSDPQTWPDGFKMMIKLQLLEEVRGGWTMTLTFSKPAPNLQIWRAAIVSHSTDYKVYNLASMSWNKDFSKCAVFEAYFIAEKDSGTDAPTAIVEFHRKNAANVNLDPYACSPTPLPTTKPKTISEEKAIPILVSNPDEWPNGFKMKIRVQFLDDVIGGWTMTLRFSKAAPGLQIWRAVIVSHSADYKVYVLGNLTWNKDFPKCAVFEAYFIAEKDPGTDAPTAIVEFHRNNADNIIQDPNACPTTMPPTTLPPTTLPPTTLSPTTLPPTTLPSTTSSPLTTQPKTPSLPTTTDQPTTQQKTTKNPTTSGQSSTHIVTSEVPTTNPTTIPATNAPTSPVTSSPAPYDYSQVLHDSILFYEAQRSGKLPSTNRISWRGDSALNDKGEKGEDLTGGWYDAGDFVKFGFPMASSVTVLAWGLVEYRDAYIAAGELDNALDSIKWATDYFIKAHTAKFEFYGQVGNGEIDHAYWGRPENMTMKRPAYKITSSKPGSDLAAETAAALAATSVVFKPTNPNYANTLIKHAEELYEFADKYRGKYSDSITDAASNYKSYSGYKDELVWGAAWLYRATKKSEYLKKAETYYQQFGMSNKSWAFSWDEKTAGAQVLLAEITGNLTSYKNDVETYLDSWLPGNEVTYTPKGLAWRAKWGPNRYSANTAFLALVAAGNGMKPSTYRAFARKQIHYMLGDSGRSFVVGFGTNPPLRPHHSSSSCPSKPASCNWKNFHSAGPNPQTLTGALVGGPAKDDSFKDDRNDFLQNEVTTDYNAGFQSAVAGLKHVSMK